MKQNYSLGPKADLYNGKGLPDTFHEYIVTMDFLEMLSLEEDLERFMFLEEDKSDLVAKHLSAALHYLCKEIKSNDFSPEQATDAVRRFAYFVSLEVLRKKNFITIANFDTARYHITPCEGNEDLVVKMDAKQKQRWAASQDPSFNNEQNNENVKENKEKN